MITCGTVTFVIGFVVDGESLAVSDVAKSIICILIFLFQDGIQFQFKE
jgi:hypothetical protein